MKKRAMILAAGFGSRMRPLTDHTPKALLTYRNKTLLQHVVERLLEQGFQDIVINIHYLGEQIINYLRKNDFFNANITISDERDQLLNIGGGLLKASKFFGEDPFLVHNVDILSDLDLNGLFEAHLEKDPLATLAVKQRETSRALLSDDELRLCGWRNIKTGEQTISRKSDHLHPIAFSGIYVLDPHIFTLIHKKGAFPIMPEILNIAKTHDILLYRHDESWWKDMGRPESYH